MRILIATTHRAIVGGVETYLQALLPLLAEQGHEIALAYEFPADTGSAAIDQALPGVPAWRLDAREPGRTLDAVSAWRPDLAYLQGLQEPASEEALLDRFPAVLFAHNYHGTCVSGTKCHARPGLAPCTRTLGFGCLIAYFPRRCGGINPLRMFEMYCSQRRRRNTLSRYRAVLVASRHMAEEFRRHGVPEERVHVLPLFPTDVRPDPEPPAPRPQTGRVLFVGRVTALKGVRLLVDALPLASAALDRGLKLVVAGDGPARAEAEAAANAAGAPADFLGWLGPERRTAEMRTADVLAVPSLWPEPFGLVGIEAGCVGLPAAGFAVGGIPDWLEAGVSGESASAAAWNAAGLADALTRTLRDPCHWQRLRHGAWEAAQRFSRHAHLERLNMLLNSCL